MTTRRSFPQSDPAIDVTHRRDVERGEWRDPEDHDVLRRNAKTVIGYRRVDQLVHLFRRGTITKQHVAAGVKLRNDYEVGELGGVGGERAEIRTSGGFGGPAAHQLDALARFRAARVHVGERGCAMLVHVVVNGQSIAAWAERHGKALHHETGYFVASLDRLEEHYHSAITSDDLTHVDDM